MLIKITYRTGSKPVEIESKERTIRDIARDCASQLASKYKTWRNKQGNPISRMALKRYEIGQEYMIIGKLEMMRK